MSTIAERAGWTLGWTIVIFLLPLGPVLGSIASVIACLCALLLIPFVLRRDSWAIISRQPAMLLFLAVFVALTICFIVTARMPADVRYAANFIPLPLAVAVFLAARRVTGADTALTIAILCGAGALMSLLIAVNDVVLRDHWHAVGYFTGPNTLGRVALPLGFVALCGIFLTRSPWRYLFYLAPIAAAIVTYYTRTRGVAIALPVAAIVFAAFLYRDPRDRRQFWMLALVALVSIAAVYLMSDVARVWSDIASFGTTTRDNSTSERIKMFGAALQLFQASPLFGHGWANLSAVAYPIMGEVMRGGPADPFFQFHSDFANFAVAGGGVGIASWLTILLAPVIGAWMSPRDALFHARLYVALTLALSFGVLGLTDITLGYDLLTTLFAFLTAIVLGAFREKAPAPA